MIDGSRGEAGGSVGATQAAAAQGDTVKHPREGKRLRKSRRRRATRFEYFESRCLLAAVVFAPPVVVDSLDADGPDHVMTADIDGDGDLDAVVGSYRDHQIAWYEYVGEGQFVKHPIGTDATEIRDLVVADLDGDQDLDIAIAAYGADSIRWYENRDGQGTFDSSITLASSLNGVIALTADDFDGDGDVDLAAVSWFDDGVAWLENDGQGQFAVPRILDAVVDGPRDVQSGDINGDGLPDLVVASRLNDAILWIPNAGGGNFQSPITLNFQGSGPESLALGDVDGDDDLDLFVALYWDAAIIWFENVDGHGTFGPQQTVSTTANRGQAVTLADLDGDGDNDVLAGSYYDLDNKLVWFPNTDGQGAFGAERVISQDVQGIEHIEVADINQDGWPDVLAASIIDNKVAWFPNQDGKGNFARPQQVLSDAGGAASTDLVDLDGDGDLDIVTASYWDNKIAWYENVDGRGLFSLQKTISNAAERAQSVRWADLDGDGDADVLSASPRDGKVAWYPNEGGSFGAQKIVTNRLQGPVYVHAADLDGDNDVDLIAASADDSIVAWFENTDGQGNFGSIQILTRNAVGVEWVSAADLDGDGDLDILAASYGDGQLSWFENEDGQATFGTRRSIASLGGPGAGGPTTVEAIDWDRDGDLDLVSTVYRQAIPTPLVWIQQTAPGEFAAPEPIGADLLQPEALRIADVDGNGIEDLIVGTDRQVVWIERLTDGGHEMHLVSMQVNQVFDVAAGDVNGDGRLDLVSASFFDSRILLFTNQSMGGDLDGDGHLDAADVDLLAAAIRAGSTSELFDLSGDGQVNFADLETMILVILNTTFGDSNLDGRFNSQDLVAVFSVGEYEDGVAGNSTWAEGDWNGDGDFGTADLVLAFQAGGYTAAAALAAIEWTAQPPIVAADHAGPTYVISADLDADGDLDLVTTSALDGRIGWYENVDGEGTFSRLKLISTQVPGVQMSVAADFDGDGDLDLAAAVAAVDRIVWFENLDGQGTFGDEQVVSNVAISTTSVAAADLDGDGDLDLISNSSDLYDSDVSWYENLDGAGTFGPQKIVSTELAQPIGAVAADVDGDGDQDIVIASYYDSQVTWAPNEDGRGSFGPLRPIGSLDGAVAVIAADIDGDGDIDVAAGSSYYGLDSIVWFANQDGQGTFGAPQTITQSVNDIATLQSVDMDGDGDLDLLSAGWADDAVIWYENLDGQGQFHEGRALDHAYRQIAAAHASDLDNDGDIDVALAAYFDGIVGWFEREGDAFRDVVVLSEAGLAGVDSIVTADFDGDGDWDIAAASVLDQSVTWFENLDGAGSFGSRQVIDDDLAGAIRVATADFNGDSRPDLVVAASVAGTITWYENRGPGQPWGDRRTLSDAMTATEAVVAVDLDGDGDQDVVATAVYGGANDLVWFENEDGQGNFAAARPIANQLTTPRDLVAADLDGDGDVDLAVVSIFDNRVAWFENLDGRGTFSSQKQISSDQRLPVVIDAGDLDGDGDADLVVGAFYDDDLSWFENLDGHGAFGPARLISRESQGVEAARLVDLDDDGDLDLLASSLVDSVIGWYENESGTGDFGPRQVIDADPGSDSDVAVADLDGDGDLDVIGAHYDRQRITWYRQVHAAAGDFNGDGRLDAEDVDRLCLALRAADQDLRFDLSGDGALTMSDLEAMILDLMNTQFGDANLDGVFNSGDLVEVFAAGQYEDAIAANSLWSTGDWNCDGEFTTADLVVAFQYGGYTAAARTPAGHAGPEPADGISESAG